MTVYLRAAQPTDAGRTGEILWDHSQAGVALDDLFSCAEAIACTGQMIDQGLVTVAVLKDRVEAFLARQGEDITSLYVSRSQNGKGLGKLLLEDAQQRSTALRLQVHEQNSGAYRFYRRLGFQEPADPGQNLGSAIELQWQRGQDT